MKKKRPPEIRVWCLNGFIPPPPPIKLVSFCFSTRVRGRDVAQKNPLACDLWCSILIEYQEDKR